MRVALTIAGSDSGGGAGIQADLKVFQRFGVFGTSALTLVTAQNTQGVTAVEPLPAALLRAQLDAVLSDFTIQAAKTGAIGTVPLLETVAASLDAHPLPSLVVDPVMVSKHGHPLLSPEAVDAFRRLLLPRAHLLTPNVHEARILTGRIIDSEADLPAAAEALLDAGAQAVLLKGGALGGPIAADLLATPAGTEWVRAPRLSTTHVHGTGCTYSAAITALLAQGRPLVEAVREAKAYVTRAIAQAPGLGSGFGPVDHSA
jgi:hydroxymethylpyrimidine/phosphomethylpyrimidine kinase